MQICIPSKGRSRTWTYKWLQEGGHTVHHFVEPQDERKYREAGVPNLVIIPDNDRGLMYVRNYILDWARKRNLDWIWILDDDITQLGIAINGIDSILMAQALDIMFDNVHKYQFPVNGINYRNYAWSWSKSKRRYAINARVADCCVLLYLPKITWRFREEFVTKGDRDFCMQAIKYSIGVCVDMHLWIQVPTIGSNLGGLNEIYKHKKDEQSSRLFVDLWKPYAEIVNKGERIDCKVYMAKYAKSLGRTVR